LAVVSGCRREEKLVERIPPVQTFVLTEDSEATIRRFPGEVVAANTSNLSHASSRTRQRNPMTAINQTSALENQLVLALIVRESVQVMAEEIFLHLSPCTNC
jgi:hypothetical protein